MTETIGAAFNSASAAAIGLRSWATASDQGVLVLADLDAPMTRLQSEDHEQTPE
jgi:hypothetical protein